MEINTTSAPLPISDMMTSFRSDLKALATDIVNAKAAIKDSPVSENEDRGEELANLTLAYRHVEDATMRLGKVIDAITGGLAIQEASAEATATNTASTIEA